MAFTSVLGPSGGPLLVFNAARVAAAVGLALHAAGAAVGSSLWLVAGGLLWLVGLYSLLQFYGRLDLYQWGVYAASASLATLVVSPAGYSRAVFAEMAVGGADPLEAIDRHLEEAVFLLVFALGYGYLSYRLYQGLAALPGDGARDLERAGLTALAGGVLAPTGIGLVLLFLSVAHAVLGVLSLRPERPGGGAGASV